MKKETIVAVSLGSGMGILLAIGIVLLTPKIEKKAIVPVTPPSTTLSNAKATNSVAKKPSGFTLTEPQQGAIAAQNTIKIAGKAPKESLIVIQSPSKNVNMKNDTDEFSVDFPLVLGENVINLSVYPKDANGTSEERELTVYLLEE